MVRSHVAQNALERSDLNRAVVGDNLVVFASLLRRHPQMGTALSRDNVAQLAQRLRQLRTAEVPRRLHRASTSSRTKWSRIILGACEGSSKKHSTASRTLDRSSSTVSACVLMP